MSSEAQKKYWREYNARRWREDPEYRQRKTEYSKKHRKENKERWRAYYRRSHLSSKYGLSGKQLEKALSTTHCECCGEKPTTKRNLHVDHDHKTGAVRGLLCHNCNLALGHAQDSISRLEALIRYLKRGGAKST